MQWPNEKGQIMIYKTLHRNRRIEQHNHQLDKRSADNANKLSLPLHPCWLLTHAVITRCIVLLSNMVTTTYRDVITCCIVLLSNMITNTYRSVITCYIVLLSNMITNTYISVITCCIVILSNIITNTYRSVITCCIVL